jgi:ArsR family transcriptional regulator, lead/cadmium/zinc/bismuth-responsive transcriptional repressor
MVDQLFHGSLDRWIDGIWMARGPSRNRHHHAPRLAAELPDDLQLEEASAMFRALGDPARLRLLAHLAGGEVCVSELAELEDENLTTVSARLKTLHTVRLVKRRREAKHIYYALSDDHVLQLVESAIEHAAERHNI